MKTWISSAKRTSNKVKTPQRSVFDSKAFIKLLPTRPGVYRMLDAHQQILYIGKARNLKARIGSYFSGKPANPKVQALVDQIAAIEVTHTQTEAEALLLESNLIKTHKPRYNITLRDDKSYPYIYLSSQDRFPRLAFHRGARRATGEYFGPYPNAYAVRDTLNVLQKLFRIRQCEDSFFKNRSRPCLQYQIQRCTAPCVDYINAQDYQQDIQHARLFLQGQSRQVIDELIERMDRAAQRLDYEQAARYRDRIAEIRKIQERQFISGTSQDCDVIACASQGDLCCVQVFYIRTGRNLGNKAFFPKNPQGADNPEILAAFIAQYYGNGETPPLLLLSETIQQRTLLENALHRQCGHKVSIVSRPRAERARWVQNARHNAEQALQMRLASKQNLLQKFEALQDRLQLENRPERIECFDISHTSGESTVAACVVFDINGPLKSDYRRFNIKDIPPGDDYAAMRQALERRYLRLKQGEAKLPDILLIDGGKGQVNEAQHVLEELQIEGVTIVGVAKGAQRIAGRETLIVPHLKKNLRLPEYATEFHLIQQIRDEAHRFAISGHRAQRNKKRKQSLLEGIPGLGPKRRQQLLKHFGGLQGIRSAGTTELSQVPGISASLAQLIYDSLHEV